MAQEKIATILTAIDQAFDHRSWHGPNLRGVLRLVHAEMAAWRPAPARHNIWELTLHAAYWKYTVYNRLVGGKRGGFDLKGSNWWERPLPDETDEAAWKSDVALLLSTHNIMRIAVSMVADGELSVTPPGHKTSTLDLLLGIAAHDLYHAGQIQLIKKMYSQRNESLKGRAERKGK